MLYVNQPLQCPSGEWNKLNSVIRAFTYFISFTRFSCRYLSSGLKNKYLQMHLFWVPNSNTSNIIICYHSRCQIANPTERLQSQHNKPLLQYVFPPIEWGNKVPPRRGVRPPRFLFDDNLCTESCPGKRRPFPKQTYSCPRELIAQHNGEYPNASEKEVFERTFRNGPIWVARIYKFRIGSAVVLPFRFSRRY